jgi:hypothetical protein
MSPATPARYPAPTPEQAERFMNDPNIVWQDAPADQPPPPAESEAVMLVRSLRLPPELDAQVQAEADARGVSWSELIRDWIAVELAALGEDQPISRADAMRALAALPRRTA